jgi:hypothetical protein
LSASALRDKLNGLSSIDSNFGASSVCDVNDDAISNIAHHCSSILVSTLLRKLHLELGLGATVHSETVGDHVFAQQHDLVSQLQEWICKSADFGVGDTNVINSSSSSSVSVWRCEAFRDLNCNFMELACSPSLVLSSLGVVASRISACDKIFEDVTTVTLQQTTLHTFPLLSSTVLSAEQTHLERSQTDHLHPQDQNNHERVAEAEDVSLTDDENDAPIHGEFPDSSINVDSRVAGLEQHIGVCMSPGRVSMFPDFSTETCCRNLQDAILLMPTAVGHHAVPRTF